jgi:alpha-2-macroglobulin
MVRDPVVLTATLPRFLLTGDRSALMRLDLDNVEGATGRLPRRGQRRPLALGEGMSQTSPARRQAARSVRPAGDATRRRRRPVACGSPGPAASRSRAAMRSPSGRRRQILTRRTVKPLAPGESITLSNDVFADLVPGTGSVALSVGRRPRSTWQACSRRSTAIRSAAPSRSSAAPCRCSMSTSLLGRQLRSTATSTERIREAIERVLARQARTAAFGLWSPGGDDAWLDAYVTDFLTRARERGFAVPDGPSSWRSTAAQLRGTAPDPARTAAALAYALYVLARNGMAPVGDLRYLADAKLAALAPRSPRRRSPPRSPCSATARAPSASTRRRWIDPGPQPTQPEVRPRRLRLDAARRGGAGDARRPKATAAPTGDHGGRASGSSRRGNFTHTPRRRKTPGWCWPRARSARSGVALDVAGTATGALYRTVRGRVRAGPLTDRPIPARIPLQAVVSVSGAPVTPEPAAENGFKIERSSTRSTARRPIRPRRSRTSASWWC